MPGPSLLSRLHAAAVLLTAAGALAALSPAARPAGARVAAGAGLAALATGIALRRRLEGRLRETARTARAVARGEHGRRLGPGGGEGPSGLASSFNTMVASLRERIEALEAERDRLDAVLRSMVEGVVAVDREERVIHMNALAARILGADPRAAGGRRLGTVTRVQGVVEALRGALASGVERGREIALPGGEGGRVLEVRAAPIRGADGAPSGAVVVLHDVSELRRLEGVRRDFVANVSHELKTPLTVVSGVLETLAVDPAMDRATRERFLERARGQTERLEAIVSDLLALARVDAGGEALEFVRLDLREPARESLRALRPAADSEGVELSEELPPGPVPVEGDRAALRLLTDNLLDNAVKYTPRGGRVTLRLRAEGGEAVLEVEDTGVGIEAQHRERIFERFYRVDRGRSRALGGTGLGLSIVRNAAVAHGGDVTCDSAPGRGSCFRVRLPLARGAPP